MKSDRELLELAAKAAELPECGWMGPAFMYVKDNTFTEWNPLTDDGDALRLAVKLKIVVWKYGQYDRAMAEVRYGAARGAYWELGDDPYAATRRAIVTAAAAIGEQM